MGFLIGIVSGIISGMGIGGGTVLIPALIFISGVTQQTAQGINLLYFLPTAAMSLVVHIKNKNVEIKTALIVGISGVFGAVGGSLLAGKLGDEILRRCFGIFLLFIGIYEIYCGFVKKITK